MPLLKNVHPRVALNHLACHVAQRQVFGKRDFGALSCHSDFTCAQQD